jgi:hypothetical protein
VWVGMKEVRSGGNGYSDGWGEGGIGRVGWGVA